jgi:uncharacterized protein (DUF427 family)
MARLQERTAGWMHAGRARPSFATVPGPGQESVWDYPRPPRLHDDQREVIVRADDVLVARTMRAIRVLETASPPTFYVPFADIEPGVLVPAPGSSYCEWKGRARYWSVRTGDQDIDRAAWSYPDPTPAFEAIRNAVAFYASRLSCTVNGEPVRPPPGGFYGGWITDDVVGPFNGAPGTLG